MKKIVFCVFIISISLQIQAQTIADKELSSLVDVVKLLRVQSEANYTKVQQILSKDLKWTTMDETGALQEQECQPSDKVPGFKLNRILSQVEGSRKYVTTHGDMVNGADKRFDYSLYERKLKAGKTVEYKLHGREGMQTFVIVPFNPSAQFNVTILTENGKEVKVVKSPKSDDGTVMVTWSQETPTVNQKFVVRVTNKTNSNQAFVIINHNSRK